MTCSHCHYVNPADARFCTGCGQALALLCPACQTPNTLDSRFCKACGTLLLTSEALQPAQRSTSSSSYTPRHLAERILAMRSALEGERKQVTVLFADVVGFSTLAGPLDPEDVHTLMDGCFEILTQQVLALQECSLRTLEQRFHLRYYLWALTAASWAYAWLGRWDDAVEEGQKALRAGEEYADSSVISFAAMIFAVVYTAKSDLGHALEHGELAVQKPPTPADKAWSQAFLAWVWCRTGEPPRGVETLTQMVSMQRAAGFVCGELHTALLLGEGYWLAGEYDKATQTLRELLPGAERCGMQFLVGSAYR